MGFNGKKALREKKALDDITEAHIKWGEALSTFWASLQGLKRAFDNTDPDTTMNGALLPRVSWTVGVKFKQT